MRVQLFKLMMSDGARTPPTEFLLIPFGDVATTKGDLKFDHNDGVELMAERAERDAEICIDYEHGALHATGPTPAAGWCQLALRADGLWAVNVRWTETAFSMIAAAEYRYFSPAYAVDKKTRHIKEFINIALTNIPATKDIRPLVAASQFTKEKQMSLADKIKKHMADKKLDSKKMAEDFAMSEERLKALSDGEEPSQEEMTKCLKAMGYGGSEDDEDDDSPPPKDDKEKKENSDGAGGLDLEAFTGHSDPKKQIIALAHMKLAQEKIGRFEKEVLALKDERAKEKRRALIDQGKSEGKLTPSLIKFWAKHDVESFEEFLSSAPSVHGEPVGTPEPGSPLGILTREELAMCEFDRTDPKVLAEFKKNEAAGTNKQLIYNTYFDK